MLGMMMLGYESAVRFSPNIKNSENFSPDCGKVIARVAEMTTIAIAKTAAKNRIRSFLDPFRKAHSFCTTCRISGTGNVYRDSGVVLLRRIPAVITSTTMTAVSEMMRGSSRIPQVVKFRHRPIRGVITILVPMESTIRSIASISEESGNNADYQYISWDEKNHRKCQD